MTLGHVGPCLAQLGETRHHEDEKIEVVFYPAMLRYMIQNIFKRPIDQCDSHYSLKRSTAKHSQTDRQHFRQDHPASAQW